MSRIALAIALLATFACLNVSPVQAYGNAPWCAVRELGTGEVEWDCEYASAAECAPTVIAGNRGFCNLNPDVAARPPGPPAAWHPRRRHHVRPD